MRQHPLTKYGDFPQGLICLDIKHFSILARPKPFAMRYPYPKMPKPGIAVLIFTLTLSLGIFFLACRKTDFGLTDQGKEEAFFRTTSKDPNVLRLIRTMKAENERTGFVGKLPKNSGAPIWDKYVMRSKKIDKSIFWRGLDGEPDSVVVIPFTSNNENLSAIIVYDSSTVSPALDCYTTNGNLYAVCHNANVDIDKAEQMLAIFLQMENRVFGTTVFYHIPAKIFKNPALPDTATSEKMLVIDTVTVQGFAADDCFVIKYCNPGNVCTPPTYCDNCAVCPWIYYCDTPPPPTGGGGGEPTPPPAPPTGGGGGGNCTNCPPPPPEPCPFGGAWYNFVPTYEPCGPTTPPIPPTEPQPPYNPNIAASITIDTSISNNYPCLTQLLTEMPNCNAETQKILYNVFGRKTAINLHFEMDNNLALDTLTDAYATDGSGHLVTVPSDTTYHYSDTIKINPFILQRASKEYLVGVLYHESFHAFLNWELYRMLNGETDSNYLKHHYPIFWASLFTNTYESFHEQMASNYTTSMANLIKLYYNPSAPDSIKNRVSNSIAWGGLEGTTAWRQPGRDTCRINSDNKAARNYPSPQTYSTTGCGSITKSAITDLKLTSQCH